MFANELKRIDNLQEEITSLRPLDEDELSQLKEYYRIGLTYSSNALEGNSLTESETKVIIEDGLTIGGKSIKEHMEVLGHSEAFSFIHDIASGNLLSEEDLLKIHSLVYGRIDKDQAGTYREKRIFLSGSKYSFPKPEEVQSLMTDLFSKLPEMKKELHPVVFAAQAHKELVFIHPFVDGNGRVSRLLMNLLLIQAGYLVTIIPPVLRSEYIASLEKAHTNDSDFIKFILRCHIEAQKEYLRLVR
ncbi:Fic family protein [Halodesulfovibrio marinisediminis]|uniref:Fic/DOC family protein n=1 Tax=Halodesulfovibrio marinisediminis DSM 17456 TaxID=1121457 RepID=A0A1N6IFI2_9BACT|nr:Fic family protein [Halodesulfovibrio marinisediminis]SIO30695.1 Fic/DOC family protein [Halodesulfovibrio marinisediminis DSM 17456]